MFVDSHCHLDFPELAAQLPEILERMRGNHVAQALCVSVNLPDWPRLMELVRDHDNLWASVGVHPDYEDTPDPTVEQLVELAATPKVVAIGETGLDYYRLTGDLAWQRDRFRNHIRAARRTGKPLIIHTRSAAQDTLRIMEEEGAADVGGVMHCFTESQAVADAAIAMNFHISFSGIVTFKNARELQEVARSIPLERILIETDSPYLAPVPHRGKLNDPSKVVHVAEKIADLRGLPLQVVADASTENFFKLFKDIRR
ncbi:TatD family hydrolase [Pigmentiphaga sp.]|uniref:TatD family hydrolase n=1 Tax=Pigmentiphaga sp. TaxID=1977564 RepID=UPI00128E8AAA|nr:TatD family hydrolase [Pigmentiphaga sp.]MPS30366.1 TatD family deoxyribonuclease [Alcaligenaceae bacterium SAGV5]MPS52336.1 TatD family deoxyribonuclease [Alcaligenaceae bacterium SAGV3]MPT57550.1 TatD family deoxyribonuclease [Alcaligenaceae bacterium]